MAYYDILYHQQPTATSEFYGGKTSPVPETVDGTVFISVTEYGEVLWGPGAIYNPYETFIQLPPTAVLGGAILVYGWHFAIPAIAAVSHMRVAAQFVASGALDWALSETETAVALAPEMIDTHTACAYLLARSGRLDEARAEFGKAVALARAVDDPTFRRRSLISLLGKDI